MSDPIDTIKQQLAALQPLLGNLSPILDEIGEILLSSVHRNFKAGGRFGNDNPFGGGTQHWAPSKRVKRQSGETLVDTAQLANSIVYRKTGTDGIVIGSNKVYAQIHQFGGVAGKGGKASVPARPFIVIQNEDLDDIRDLVLEYYSTLLT